VAIEIRGLSKSFGELSVYRNLDLGVEESRVTALLGPSGCGKTTLLDMVAGVAFPDSGRIEGIEGRKVGYVFQEPRLLPWKTVLGNIEFVLRDLFDPRECRARAGRWVELVGLSPFAEYYPNELSGGMRQRVGIARAFAYPSNLLLLDEPFQALDLGLKLGLVEVVDEAWRMDRRTTLFVTHDIGETLLLADDLFVLSAAPAEVRAHFRIDLPHGNRSLADDRLIEIERKLYTLLATESK